MSEVKERPILMKAPMVRALLDGTKTQTRRVLKIQPLDVLKMKPGCPDMWICLRQRNPSQGHTFVCRHGKPGDRLWVKETFFPMKSCKGPASYRATWPADDEPPDEGWTPSIFMPRKLSRITLEITDVRCQRVQEITDDDAIAEGIQPFKLKSSDGTRHLWGVSQDQPEHGTTPRTGYSILWDSINGKTPGDAWKDNPFCWAISFRKLS